MTYCVAAAASTGIVFASDSRTNAGTAEIASHSKMSVFEAPGERVLVLLSAGNLATSQSVINLLDERRQAFMAKPSLFHMVEAIGETLREVMARDGRVLAKSNIDATASFIAGGQIRGEAPRLFMVYPQGNFIEASKESPFLQLGETQYAKPLLDTVLGFGTALDDAARCLLLAMEVTMRLNVAVGAPVELLAYEKDRLRVTRRRRFEEGDASFAALSAVWARGMKELCERAPKVEWH